MRRKILAFAMGLLLFASVSAAENRGPALVGYLVLSEGTVELKRAEWKDFHPARAGTRLEIKDQLRLDDGARALVLCADFETTWRPTRGERSNVAQGCRKPPTSISELPNGLAAGTRGQAESERIRSPRGAIRELAPRIRWESFGVQEYEVQVSLGRKTIWGPVLVLGTEQEMPSGFLEPERPYRLQLRPAGMSEFVEPVIPFHVITEGRRSQIAAGENALLARIQEGKKEKDLAHALYLVHQHLWGEALAILETILPELDSAASQLWGANLALGLGFQRDAAGRYEKVREMAREQGDLETEAAATIGLAHTATESKHSEKWFQEALVLYERLGDQNKVQALSRRK